MSTIKTTNIQHPSAASPSIVLASTGNATYAGVHDFNAATVTGAGGLRLVTPTGVDNSGGTATASGGEVTFSGVTTVSLNGIFTSSYANYRIVIFLASSGSGGLQVRLRKSGSDNSSANYEFQNTTLNNTSLTGTRSTGQTSYTFMRNAAFAQPHFQTFLEIGNPQVNDETTIQNLANYRVSAGALNAVVSGYHNVVDQFDGLTFYADSPTTISGTIRVYGYQNS
jgi:hypothetical protein